MSNREPPIATLPHRPASTDSDSPRFVLVTSPLERGPSEPPGYARTAALRVRRLGWLLWGLLAALVLVLSSTS